MKSAVICMQQMLIILLGVLCSNFYAQFRSCDLDPRHIVQLKIAVVHNWQCRLVTMLFWYIHEGS